MQCQGKLMNQTWKNDKKPSFRSKHGPHNFLQGFYLYCLLNKRKTLWPFSMDEIQLPQGYSHFEAAVYLLPLSPQKFLVLTISTSEEWKAKWQFHIKSSNFFKTWHSYPSEFLYFCTICRYHWNMRTLKISIPYS